MLCNNECTKVQNPRHHHVSGYSWPLVNTIMRMRTFHRKIADYISTEEVVVHGSLQWSGFREKPQLF